MSNAAYLAADRWRELFAHASDALAEAEAHDDLFVRCDALLHMSRAALMQDEPARAAVLVDEAQRRWTSAGYLFMHYLNAYYSSLSSWYGGGAREGLARLSSDRRSIERALLLRLPIIAGYARYLRGCLCAAVALEAPADERRALLDTADADARSLAAPR